MYSTDPIVVAWLWFLTGVGNGSIGMKYTQYSRRVGLGGNGVFVQSYED
jgi:hypothetical protein